MESSGSRNSLENAISFDQILNATVRMIRVSWKASFCVFMQTDDTGNLRVRAADGLPATSAWFKTVFKSSEGSVAQCLGKNQSLEVAQLPDTDAMAPLTNPAAEPGRDRFVLVPVSGEARALGMLVVGPFSKEMNVLSKDAELKSAGALCAVLSAHWRLYEWMSHFIPQVNHELRTPLTAVQGSIGMVLGGMFGQVGTEVRQMLEMAHNGCERTVRAIEDYLNQQQPPPNNGNGQ
jgi:signal transduction histidine kinase